MGSGLEAFGVGEYGTGMMGSDSQIGGRSHRPLYSVCRTLGMHAWCDWVAGRRASWRQAGVQCVFVFMRVFVRAVACMRTCSCEWAGVQMARGGWSFIRGMGSERVHSSLTVETFQVILWLRQAANSLLDAIDCNLGEQA